MTTGATGSAQQGPTTPMYHPTTGERLYGQREALILARRALCENGDGHQIELVIRTHNWDGKPVVQAYGCRNCDVDVTLSYPEV